MIRFDEVPINRIIKKLRKGSRTKYESYTKVSIVLYWSTEFEEEEECNSIDSDGYPHLFDDSEMVELVDKCSNCKHYDSNIIEKGNHPKYCHKILAYIGVEYEDINDDSVWNVDPETFKCSNWEEK